MCVPRSLITHRITVRPGKCLRLFRFPEQGPKDPAKLDFDVYLKDTAADAVVTADGWIVVLGHGALPLRKIPGYFSFEEALDYEVVDICKKTNEGFVPVETVGEL